MKLFTELKRNGLFGLVKYGLDKLYSVIFYRKNILIRSPRYIRNQGVIEFGQGFSTGPGLIIDVFEDDR